MSDKSELKAELERKKQRLAQIREEKKRKEEERKKQAADQLKDAAQHQDDSDLEKKRREADALLQSMGITSEAPVVPPPISPTTKSAGTPSEAGSQDSDGAVGPRRGTPKLGMAKVTQVDFPPRETVSYTKETQTPVMTQQKEDLHLRNGINHFMGLLAFILAVIAMVAVFDFHNAAKIPNMYSLHSWLGLTALMLFCLQLVLGVGIYLIPVTPASWRAAFMPLHVYGGLLLFTSVIAVALMGITEKLIFGLSNPKYKDSPPEAIFVNVLGVVLVVFGALILWIATRTSWKRPSDQVLHTLHTSGEGEDSSKVGPVLSQLSDGTDAEPFGDIRRRSNKLDDQAN